MSDDHDCCASYGCEDDGAGRCTVCYRRLPDASHFHDPHRAEFDYMGRPRRLPAKDRLKKIRSRAKERRALMRGRRQILRDAAHDRRRGEPVPRDIELVHRVEVLDLGHLYANYYIGENMYFVGFPAAHITNESGCLHCDGSGPDNWDSDRQDCNHGHALDF